MAEIGFRERLAYLRWLRARGRVRPETDAELAGAFGVGEKWLAKWKGRAQAPEGRTEEAAIKAVLGAETTGWLYDGTGPAPEPARWREWAQELTERAASSAPPRHGPSIIKEPPDEVFNPPLPRKKPGQRRA